MLHKEAVTTALRRAGPFPAARSLARRISREVQAGLAADSRLYGCFIRSGDLVFDVSGNLGQKPEVFLALGARVVSVEPNPLCAPTVRWQFGRDPRIRLILKALADRPGRVQLNVPVTSLTASLRDDWGWLGLSGQRPKKVDVEITTLDALIAEFGVPVEGFELEVLQGSRGPCRACLSNITSKYSTACGPASSGWALWGRRSSTSSRWTEKVRPRALNPSRRVPDEWSVRHWRLFYRDGWRGL